MKKLFLFLLIAAFSISCGGDDDADVNPIIGTWKPISERQLNTDTNIDDNSYDVCQQNTRITYNENGTASAIIYYGNNLNDCTSDIVTGVEWIKLNNELTLTIPGIGAVVSNLTFSNNNNNMTEVTIDGPYVITTVYVRQ